MESTLSKNSLVDQPMQIKINKLSPNQKATIKLKTSDKFGNSWHSEAVFKSDDKGTIDLETEAPLEGSYNGIDGMGLFWSMTSSFPSMYIPPESSIEYQLEVWQDSKCLKEEKFTRHLFNDINEKHIISDKLNAIICIPKKQVSTALVVCLTGSNGGLSPERARLLASHGIPTCALGYFKGQNLPEALEEIALERVVESIQEVKKLHPSKIEKIVLFGKSKGAELSLCLASYFPSEFDGVIASLPSSYVWCSPNNHKKSSWTFQGSPLPFIPPIDNMRDLRDLTKAHLRALKEHKTYLEGAKIPVEKISCPILLISAEDDRVWPSALFGDIIKRTLEKNPNMTHLKYKKAGHILTPPYYPTTSTRYWHNILKEFMETGGNPIGHHKANLDSWNRIKKFISKLS